MTTVLEKSARNLALCVPGPLRSLDHQVFESVRVREGGYHEGNNPSTIKFFVDDFKDQIKWAAFGIDMRSAQDDTKSVGRITDEEIIVLLKQLVEAKVPHLILAIIYDTTSDLGKLADRFSDGEKAAIQFIEDADFLMARKKVEAILKKAVT